ncbi:GrpB family protein [Oceanicaulis sp. MMSF_3324]|uniref:GrpB family protein n=1 Tax=Oceanicaulis sp. MMSF_3324 TaxID=3046702 RepID=UPI00273F26A7|nr:GrpB family protein [Oceanicaulis sp. MMSF_3324]
MSDDSALFLLSPDPEDARQRALAAFETWRRQHARQLPRSAEALHVGATAIEGCETKGDLDIAVRVPEEDFEAARDYLDRTHTPNPRSARRKGFVAYLAPGYAMEVDVKLVVNGDEFDRFTDFRDALLADKALLARYNALKRAYRGREMERYRDAKGAFIRDILKGV